MAWVYISSCAFDFMIAPIGWAIIQALMKVNTLQQWHPITLEGAGLYHLSMGAILGLAAWGRSQEKIYGAAGNYRPYNNYGYNRYLNRKPLTYMEDTDSMDHDELVGRKG